MKMHVPKKACSTCPYRRDTPLGVWSPEEYEKLRVFDKEPWEDLGSIKTFHCHQENVTRVQTVCRGWLDVHQDGVCVRIAVMNGSLASCDVPTEHDPLYYESGNAAADAGLAGVLNPPDEAQKAMDLLLRKGTFKLRDRK